MVDPFKLEHSSTNISDHVKLDGTARHWMWRLMSSFFIMYIQLKKNYPCLTRIINISKREAGKYFCRAENGAGR